MVAGFSVEAPKEREVGSPIIKGQKACTFCQYYERREQCCPLTDSHRERYDGKAYFCSYYS